MLTNGAELRQFIHIGDVCRALHGAMMQQLQGVYDVTSFEWVTVRQLADIIAQLTGAVVVSGRSEGNTPITPIRGKIPGWVPEVSLEDGLHSLVEDVRSQLA